MDFKEVLSSAWKIIWKNKILWIFGILANCGSANGGYMQRLGGSENKLGTMDRDGSNSGAWIRILS